MKQSLYLEICKAIGVRITDALKPENMKQSLETEKSEASEAKKTDALKPENMKQSLETEKSEASEAEKTDAMEPKNMKKSFYQKKYEDFKKEITKALEPDSLKKTSFQSVSELLEFIKNNLPKQAKENFDNAANVDVFEDFISVTGCNPDDRNCEWEKVGDFVLRLSLGAFDKNGCRITPETALKTIFTNLMENLGEYMTSKGSHFEVKTNEKNCKLLNEFFSKYKLRDTENSDSAPFEEGIREYLKSCCKALQRERFDGDGVSDDHIILLNKFITRISDKYLKKDVAVMILMRGAPTSIWAMKCIQAGISKFEWSKKS